MFKKDKEKTTETWLELIENNGWRRVVVKWDGCIDYRRYFNTPYPQKKEDEMEDYIHICDIDEEIEYLKEIKRLALEHFSCWPG